MESQIQKKAALVRKWCLISTTEAGSGHPTSCLSAADMATVLFDKYFTYDIDNPLNLYNDRFVLSKGHAAPLLYTLFCMAGAYPLDELKNLRKFGSRFQGHPTPLFPFADAATGSLGQGLSIGAGLALLAKRENLPGKTYVLLGDGELAEGQNWEAADFASFYLLDNLVAIADINRLGQSGETMFEHHVEKYVERFRAFGFEVMAIDGHNIDECSLALERAISNKSGKPFVIVMKTLKGKGVSLVEDKEGWHGKALNREELQQALEELGATDDHLRFQLKMPKALQLPDAVSADIIPLTIPFEKDKETGLREAFGEALAKLGERDKALYVLDGDVKNSTYTQDFYRSFPKRFIEGYIAEQNMVSVAVALAHLGKTPVVATFGSFLSRAFDQIRMARISNSNIKFVGTHVGVSIGEDGPSQMALEDIAMFGSLPGTVILQPADAVAAVKLTALMLPHRGFVYMRVLRPKTKLIYDETEAFEIGGSSILKQSANDMLTVAATGITVHEALEAAARLEKQGIPIRVVDCYSIQPIDKTTLVKCLKETTRPILITIEDHFAHGGMGDFALAALSDMDLPLHIEKMAVEKISQSGKMPQLLNDAGINAAQLVNVVKGLLK